MAGVKIKLDDVPMGHFASTIVGNKYSHSTGRGNKEDWYGISDRVVESVVKPFAPRYVEPLRKAIRARKFMPGGRYLYASGLPFPQVNNCFLFKVDEDSRQGWGRTSDKAINALMTGGGVGIVYTPVRGADLLINGMGGRSTGPCSLMQMINENGRHIIQGGSRRAALWAGLHWWHTDIKKFIAIKDWPQWLRSRKVIDFNTPAPMDGTNISVILDSDFFAAMKDPNWIKTYTHSRHTYTLTHKDATEIYWMCIEHMLRTGEPGFSVDIGENEGCNLRNACTEVTSADNDDMCNLGSLNLARIYSREEFNYLTELGIIFLLCGTQYSVLPLPEMYKVREQNRRLGLGLMGVHEWLIRRGRPYGPDQELGDWLDVYARSGAYANLHADIMGISRPIATRSIAPTGTIAIAAETTGGIEPIFAAAYLRRYLKGTTWHAQHVLDSTAKRLVEDGVDPDLIEDSYTLSEDIDRRIHFQTWVQKHVDHGISSTLNLPPWGSSINNENTVKSFGLKMLKYLPELRGITTYPDGARDGQPLTRMTYREAISRGVDREFVEQDETNIPEGAFCKGGVCGE